MQHLPTLVFRGDDQEVAREALQRSARLFHNPQETQLERWPSKVASPKTWDEGLWISCLK